MLITNKFNVAIHAKGSHQHGVNVPHSVNQNDVVRFYRSIDLNIAPGQYVLGFALFTMQSNIYAQLDELPQAEVNNQLRVCDVYEKVDTFFVKPYYSTNEHSHFGICNLPGECQIQVVSNLEAERENVIREHYDGS